ASEPGGVDERAPAVPAEREGLAQERDDILEGIERAEDQSGAVHVAELRVGEERAAGHALTEEGSAYERDRQREEGGERHARRVEHELELAAQARDRAGGHVEDEPVGEGDAGLEAPLDQRDLRGRDVLTLVDGAEP